MFNSCRQVGDIARGKIAHLLKGFTRVNLDQFGIDANHIAQGPYRQGKVFVNDGARRHGVDGFQQSPPQLGQKRNIALQFPFIHPFRGGTNNTAANLVFGSTGLQQGLQPLAFSLVFNLDRNSDHV